MRALNERDERGWRIPTAGTRSMEIYQLSIQGHKPKEIAEMLKMNINTVRVLKFNFVNWEVNNKKQLAMYHGMPKERKKERRKSTRRHKRGVLPTEAEVRAAVEKACSFTGADVTDVLDTARLEALGISHNSAEYKKVSCARFYSMLALRACFEDGRASMIASMCGLKGTHNYFGQIDNMVREGTFNRWWKDAEFMSVIEAIEAFQKNNQSQEQEMV